MTRVKCYLFVNYYFTKGFRNFCTCMEGLGLIMSNNIVTNCSNICVHAFSSLANSLCHADTLLLHALGSYTSRQTKTRWFFPLSKTCYQQWLTFHIP